ncbi:pantoate--beta-alanine ligase [bacterium]|nr:pantoate--beta-alanine ligase [bacterium]
MKIFRKIKEYNEYFKGISKDKIVGFVPTMGALHEGHLSLVRCSKKQSNITGVSIFINPLQFGPSEDLDSYPKQEKQDLKLLENENVDFVFIPSSKEMYPEKMLTNVKVSKLQDNLCGAKRPGHFDGVTTVVIKLFNIIRPDKAFFGLKDFQQYTILKKMVNDLNFHIDIIGCEIIREKDGLAMSSRNKYLTEDDRKIASNINIALKEGMELIKETNYSVKEIIDKLKTKYFKDVRIDYFWVYDRYKLFPLQEGDIPVKDIVITGAFFIGKARLIDNMRL